MNVEDSLYHNVLYRRAKQSDMMQGILDTLLLVHLEFEKLRFMHNYYSYNGSMGHIESQIQNWRGQFYQIENEIQELRKKGL